MHRCSIFKFVYLQERGIDQMHQRCLEQQEAQATLTNVKQVRHAASEAGSEESAPLEGD